MHERTNTLLSLLCIFVLGSVTVIERLVARWLASDEQIKLKPKPVVLLFC
jgi:hypothetical protein